MQLIDLRCGFLGLLFLFHVQASRNFTNTSVNVSESSKTDEISKLANSSLSKLSNQQENSENKTKDPQFLAGEYANAEVNERPFKVQAFLILTVIFAGLISSIAVFFNWYTAFVVLFKVSRRMRILENKMCLAQEFFNKRAFSEALIGKLANMAKFDFTALQNEAETALKSMAGGTFVQ
uniref:ABC transmembrane type-1 domain-containing protein n=1 Tax=Panagrolaimus sp. JU765 TaxID=591449 RepID=A0AC34QL16_9BILA